MRFGQKLRKSIYKPWERNYIEYGKLKGLLREDADDAHAWTEDDENKFSEELLNVQLAKVADFQETTFKQLEQRTTKAGDKLKELTVQENAKGDITIGRYKELEEELDAVTNETKELKSYSNINYTGFLKIVKKHDRKRGNSYKMRPLLQRKLADRPFNNEQGYSPLIHKLSLMYFVIRQQFEDSPDHPEASSDTHSETHQAEKYTAYKFWVHPDNLLEVKTFILRRLPVLIYSEKTAKELEAQGDPTINSLYFDNPDFSLYSDKLDQRADASSLRIRWYGLLNSKPDLVLEQKIIHENGSSEERRIPIKEKYIQDFITGKYKMEKSIQKMERQFQPAAKIEEFKTKVHDIQNFILDNGLEPVLRANYTRTAFQKPLDDRVRVSIDTQVAFIREDTLDSDRPCRDSENWHRFDIDNSSMVYPFSNIRKGEISNFPFSILEIKVKESVTGKQPQWVDDLGGSHLVHKVVRFSKFVHGVASLFEDQVNNYPPWFSEVETDILKDPKVAFDEEEKRKVKAADDEAVIGSLLGTSKMSSSYQAKVASPVGESYMSGRVAAEERAGRRSDFSGKSKSQKATEDDAATASGGYGTLSSIFPSISLSKYAEARRARERIVTLPPGVTEPLQLIKDSGPLKVEPKVWLANERTFIKWQHIAILMGAFALALFNTAGGSTITTCMSAAYIVIAVFTSGWGWYMHRTRRDMIIARSGKDFDNFIGPIVVAIALMVALIVNFILRWQQAIGRLNDGSDHTIPGNGTEGWEAAARLDLL